MAIQGDTDALKTPVRFVDKEELNRLLEELNAQMGFVPDPNASHERLEEMMLADGVQPEDNLFSREIIRMRYGSEEE